MRGQVPIRRRKFEGTIASIQIQVKAEVAPKKILVDIIVDASNIALNLGYAEKRLLCLFEGCECAGGKYAVCRLCFALMLVTVTSYLTLPAQIVI